MLPNEEGEIWHNAVYNDISSNNIENLDKFINKWPHNFEELDEVLAKAYGELKLKNVRLENETEIFIENKLINLHFFSNTSRHEQIISDVDGQLIITKALQVIDQYLKSTLEFSKLLNNIRERIELTVESIRLLKTDYSNTEKVDGKFIFLAKFIAKNIHVLKQQLNSTHDRLPWEQMEFCLVIFIASYTKRQEMNLYYRATLNKRKILSHIENFAVELEAQTGELLSSKHDPEVRKIINGYPGFEELYKDNQQIREVQSLVKISEHINSKVLKCNPKKKDGQLIIAKALNLIGEYLESTWEFSKLFNNITTSEQNNTSKIIEELRNSLSLLATSPPERIGTEENRDFNFSLNVQEDVRKVGDVITLILNEVNTNEEGIFVNNELISLSSFFKDPTYKSDNDKNTLIELILQNISLLKRNYSNMEEVDEKFIFTTKSIEQSISKIERQLKLNCDRLLWKEMEFCLSSFVTSYTKKHEMNLYYRATLNKRKILRHIENFAFELEAQKDELLPEVMEIINGYPGFEELYKDNQQIREVQSLVKISEHIKSKVLRCNPKKEDGQLIIAEALNLIGKYLESTWKFSKLFTTTSEQKNTSKIIVELRNSLSLLATLPPERIGTEENRDFNFSLNVQEDIRKVGDVITRILNEVNTNKEGIFAKNELIFFMSIFKFPSYKSDNNKNTWIELILQNISLLKRNYSNMEEVDEMFIFKTKCIEQSISEIERQLKLNCDRLLWKEMKFCLSSFVTSYTINQEMNPCYRAILNKFRILSHLENFAKKLENKNIENEQVVTKKSIPEFADLYKDFQQIRDVHSLRKISDHIKLALSTNIKEKDGLLIITRVLQVIGEHLTKTQGSPKLSDTISELLLLSLQKKARNILKDLRDLLSHDENDSLSKRKEIEEKMDENFFLSLKNDMKKVGNVITDILYNNEIEIIRTLLNQIVACENSDEINDVTELFTTVQFDEIGVPENFKIMEEEKVEELVNELYDNIADKMDYEKDIFNQIKCEIKRVRSRSDNLRSGYANRFIKLKRVINSLNIIKHDPDHNIKVIKLVTIDALLNISSGIESTRWENISVPLMQIGKIIFSRNPSNIVKLILLMYDIRHIAEFEKGDIKLIEKIKEKLNEESSFTATKKGKNKQSKIYKVTEEQYNKQLEVKLSELKRILSKINSLSGSATDKLSSYKMQAVVEMLVLDVMGILDNSKNYLENNVLLLDDNAPLLNGKCLRNHLAHDNALFDVLFSDPSMALIANAKILTEENIIESKKKIGKFIKDDLLKLREKYNRDLFIITNQERMFVALEEGHLEIVKDCLKSGADVNARSINSWTTLHFAAKGQSLEVVEFIMSWAPLNLRGINIHGDFNGQSPLHIAAAYGRTSIVECFITRYSFDVHSLNNRGETPLHLAAQNGHKDTVEVLLQNNANTVTKDECYRTPVDYAILNNHTDVAKILLKRGKSYGNKTVDNGPLLLAAYVGNLDVVNFLLEHNVEVNATADDNETPLHFAAFNGHLEVVNFLIEKGADVNAPTLIGCTPLQYAIVEGHEEIFNILLKLTDNVNAFHTIDGNSHLHCAVVFGQLGIVKTLLEKGAEVNFPNIENKTPLHFAARFGHSEICSAFLNYRVTIDARDKNNFTPLHYAAENGQIEAAVVLVENGADLNATGYDNLTPLHYAAANGNKDVIDFLINNNANVNAASNAGNTPLFEAALRNHGDAVKILVKNNTDINARDNNGVTALGAAVVRGNKDVVQILIENNVRASTISNNHGDNIKLDALKLAVISGHTDIVKMLLENEDIVNMPLNKDNITLIHLAAGEGHKEIVNVLLKKGADPNAIGGSLELQDTPLLSAVRKGDEEMVETLIAGGANVNLELVVSPLHLAVAIGHSTVVNVLLKNKADIDIKDKNNLTPLELAVVCGDLKVVKVLLEHNNLLNDEGRGIHGYTLLHIASKNSNLEMVEYLVDVGFDINARNAFGVKPIHVAARYGRKDTVDFFLRTKGLSIEDPGERSRTLLHYAAQDGHLKVVIYLIVEGADVNAKDDNGLTALHIAVQFGYKEVIQVLIKNGALYNAVDHARIQQLFQDSNGGLFHRFNRKIKKLITPSIFFPIIFVFMFYICGVAFGQIEISAIM